MKTAVEHAQEIINIILYYLDDEELQRVNDVFEQAKEMEKQQRISDFIAGCNACGFEYSAEDWAKEYFEKNSKSE